MDEDELDEYLDAIDLIDPLLAAEPDAYAEETLVRQLREEETGFRVPGCYYTKIAPF